MRIAFAMTKLKNLKFDLTFFEAVLSSVIYPGFRSPDESQKFLKKLFSDFVFESGTNLNMIFKILRLCRLNLDFVNEEDIDAEFLDSILKNPKSALRIFKFLGLTFKDRIRLPQTLRFHFYKLKERYEEKSGLSHWWGRQFLFHY